MRNAPRTQLMIGYDNDRVPRTYRRRRREHNINSCNYCNCNVGGGDKQRIIVQPSGLFVKTTTLVHKYNHNARDQGNHDDQGGGVVFTTGLSRSSSKHGRLRQMVFLFIFFFSLSSFFFSFVYFRPCVFTIVLGVYVFGLVELDSGLMIVGRMPSCRWQCL